MNSVIRFFKKAFPIHNLDVFQGLLLVGVATAATWALSDPDSLYGKGMIAMFIVLSVSSLLREFAEQSSADSPE